MSSPTIALLCVAALAPLSASQELREMTADDVLRIVSIEGAELTPDGEHVLYTERRLDWDENDYTRHHFLVPFGGGDPVEFIGAAGGEDLAFSPDGRWLALLREVEEDDQIFLMPVTGGEAVQLTEHRGGVRAYRWTADSRRLFFVAEEARPEEREAEWKKGDDAHFVDEGPNGKRPGKWSNLWTIDVESRSESRVTNEEHRVEDFDPSPDGTRVVYTARRENRVNWPHLSELYLAAVGDGAPTRLTANMAPEASPLWSPDGSRIAFAAPDDERFELTIGYFWLLDPETGAIERLSGQPEGELAGDVVWPADGSALLFSAVHGTNTNLHEIDVVTGEVARITDAVGTLRAEAFSADRTRMVYSFHDFDTPPDLWTSDLARTSPTRLTDANPWIASELLLGSGSVLQWQSADGVQVEGTLLLPADQDENARVPLMLNIHGGPSGYWGNEFDPDQHVYAGLGWAVLGPNVRGSTGYGDEHLRGLMGDVGGGEYEDLMSGVDHAIEMGIADPERMALRGWSWGGVLGGWVVTHTDRFRAASLGAMVGSWTAETGPGFNFDLTLWYIGSTHWDDPERWRAASSLSYVKQVTTPTLLLHGAEDRTSSTGQSLMFFTALKDRGVPTRYISFPREGHGIREPRHRRTRIVEEVRWMQRHALGEQWEPWVRETAEATPRER
jgi:dipeptidyl aminopeptidase/acylaminoacyl peptidase